MAMCEAQSPLCAATDSAIAGQTRAISSMQMQYSTDDIPAPPNSSANWMPVSPRRGELRQQIHREVLRLVPLHHVRADLRFGELAHRAAKELLLVSRTEIHGTKCIKGTGKTEKPDELDRVRVTADRIC